MCINGGSLEGAGQGLWEDTWVFPYRHIEYDFSCFSLICTLFLGSFLFLSLFSIVTTVTTVPVYQAPLRVTVTILSQLDNNQRTTKSLSQAVTF